MEFESLPLGTVLDEVSLSGILPWSVAASTLPLAVLEGIVEAQSVADREKPYWEKPWASPWSKTKTNATTTTPRKPIKKQGVLQPQRIPSAQAGKAMSRRSKSVVTGPAGAKSSLIFSSPVSYGRQSKSFNTTSNDFQRMTDISGPGSTIQGIRVRGSDLCSIICAADGKNTDFGVLFGPSSSSYPGYGGNLPLTPSMVSPRLSIQETLYQYYAFREMRIRYVPSIYQGFVSGTTSGSNLMAFGLISNAEEVSGYTLTFPTIAQNVMQLSESISGPLWSPMSIDYRFTGTRLWETSSESEAAVELLFQVALAAGCVVAGNNAATYGYFEIDYVLDLYCPITNQSSPTLMLSLTASYDRSLARELQAFLLSKGVLKLETKKNHEGRERKRYVWADRPIKNLLSDEVVETKLSDEDHEEPDQLPEGFVSVQSSSAMSSAGFGPVPLSRGLTIPPPRVDALKKK